MMFVLSGRRWGRGPITVRPYPVRRMARNLLGLRPAIRQRRQCRVCSREAAGRHRRNPSGKIPVHRWRTGVSRGSGGGCPRPGVTNGRVAARLSAPLSPSSALLGGADAAPAGAVGLGRGAEPDRDPVVAAPRVRAALACPGRAVPVHHSHFGDLAGHRVGPGIQPPLDLPVRRRRRDHSAPRLTRVFRMFESGIMPHSPLRPGSGRPDLRRERRRQHSRRSKCTR